MAVINGVSRWIARGVLETTWSPLANGDTGTPLDAPSLADKTVTVRGTFGASGSVSIKGTDSGDGTASTGWDVLNDTRGEGNAMTFTARDTRMLTENPARIAPHVTAGDGTTALTVVIVCQSPMR